MFKVAPYVNPGAAIHQMAALGFTNIKLNYKNMSFIYYSPANNVASLSLKNLNTYINLYALLAIYQV